MRVLARPAAIFVAALTLAGCATMSEEECLSADWRALGIEDGARGRPDDYFSRRGEACARHGVAPDYQLWSMGYGEGLPRYCTALNGVRVGATGERYHGVCAGRLAAAFVPAYEEGRAYYALTERADDIRRRINDVENRIDDYHDEIRDERARLDDPDLELSEDERRAARHHIRALENDVRDAEYELNALDYDLHDFEIDIDFARDALRARYPGSYGW